ncbi:uncharacterized protein LOC115626108 [Scaptodrosophila lebanonensis]|uniref:Uncharacterized protein LOC115626108 n=1 Tax=Drosophila lebanonensis TaxID=7225 RepID=A0A6J2TQ38_DROLE|nr:uncharacterized protein LOC115626108 [Scaptodrosophila lebanonensis]
MPEYRNLLWLVLPLFNLILSAPVGAESFNADAIKSEIQFSIIARNCSLALHKVQDKFYYIESYEKLNWFEANAACIQAGLQLTTISSEQEFFELESYLSRMGFRGDWIWIGGFGRASCTNTQQWLDIQTHAQLSPGSGSGRGADQE